MAYENITTHQIQAGDRIMNYGMVLLVDQDVHESKAHPANEKYGPVLYTHALIENWDEVNRLADDGHDTMRFIRNLVAGDMSEDGVAARNGRRATEPRWSIQGNGLAHWSRIV